MMTYNTAKQRCSHRHLLLELLSIALRDGRHAIIGLQEVMAWNDFTIKNKGYSFYTFENCDCGIVVPSIWSIRDSCHSKRFMVLAFESFMVISMHLVWWGDEDGAEILEHLFISITAIRNKHVLGADLPLIILTDANVSLKRNWSIDEQSISHSNISEQHFVSGPLTVNGSHNEKDKLAFVSFCHCLGLSALNTWDWQSSSTTNHNQTGSCTYFSRSSEGSNSHID